MQLWEIKHILRVKTKYFHVQIIKWNKKQDTVATSYLKSFPVDAILADLYWTNLIISLQVTAGHVNSVTSVWFTQ